jgi:predicted nucleic acid-binding protein
VTADSSVLVAAFATWHERHDEARRKIREVHDLVAQAELEAYSVLTRLPEPFRMRPAIVAQFLGQFAGRRLVLGASARGRLVHRLAELELTGGAAYDALIGATAAAHAVPLLTLDQRAARVYERVGASAVALSAR